MTARQGITPQGETRARRMLDRDSGSEIDTRDELRAALRIVVDALDAERLAHQATLAALEAVAEDLREWINVPRKECVAGPLGAAYAALARSRGGAS